MVAKQLCVKQHTFTLRAAKSKYEMCERYKQKQGQNDMRVHVYVCK